MTPKPNLIGGILLIAGTSIGGGMLALPVLTSVTGFWPALAIYLVCWLFMASTGLLFLETSEWMHREANIVSMASKTLGFPGKVFAWGLYLFLFYSLTVAYIVGSGSIVVEFFQGHLPDWLGPFVFLIFFFPLILIPTAVAGRMNIFLMIGLILSYLAFVAIGIRYVNPDLLTFTDWSKTLKALPIAFTAFAYQGTVPTLISYLHHDKATARKAIIIGSFLPFIAYAVWQALIMGIVPVQGAGGLAEALEKGQNAVQPLKNILGTSTVYLIGQFFAFFALVTSFLGVTLGLRDFLSDGLNIEKSSKGKLILASLIFIPSLTIAMIYPHVFLIALEYAGGLGCALLLGLLPILMVWRGRYHLKLGGEHQLSGGKPLLILLGLFVVLEVGLELKRILLG